MRLLPVLFLALTISDSVLGQTYTIDTVAGGQLPENVPGTSAVLNNIGGIAADAAGNVFITSSDSFFLTVVLRLDARTDLLARVAGNWTLGYSGDNGPATNAQLRTATGVAVDAAGNLYIADTGNSCIRKVSNGVITTIVGTGTPSFSGDDGPATSAQLGLPINIALDAAGNLYIAGSNRIRKVSNGVITTIVGTGTPGFSGDNGPATSAQLYGPNGIALDAAGNLYIADQGNNRIRKVSNGVITTVAGNGTSGIGGDNGPATSAQLLGPTGVAVDAVGDLYILESYRIRRVSGGFITTVAGGGGGSAGPATNAQLTAPNGVAVGATGDLYIADTYADRILKVSGGVITPVAGNGYCCYSGDDGPATSAQLDYPNGVTVDATGNVYLADTATNRVREVSNGVITTVAGGAVLACCYIGDDGPATSAQLFIPNGVAVDTAGNLYIADTSNNRVRKVSNGVITTVAGNGMAGFSGDNGPATSAHIVPASVAVDEVGNVYIADKTSDRIFKVAGGVITTIAGTGERGFSGDNGPATSAQLYNPAGVAVDAAGKVYIADAENHRVRVLVPSGPPCSYSVNPLSSIVAAPGGTITVGIQTSPSCSWAISGLPGWITVPGNAVGAGPATVTLTVASNPAGPRRATVSIAGVAVTVTQDASPGLSWPTITAVTNAATGTVWTIQSSSWVAIWGSNLAPANSGRTWDSRDIINGNLPTSLDGVSVTINGKPAFVEYISPGQLNVLAPDDDAVGPVNVIVTNQGAASAPFSVPRQWSSPAFFAFSPPNQKYVAGVFPYRPDNSFDAYLAPGGTFGANVPSRPAKPGDIVQLYGTGFGPTSPKPPEGQVFFAPFPAVTQPTVTIGGIPAKVAWAGLSAAGVYQLNVTVPQAVPDGDAEVLATVGGVQSQDGTFIPVQH